MTSEQFVIKIIEEQAGEWLEMADDPNALLIRIMAKKITKLLDDISYLKKRLKHDSSTSTYKYRQELRSRNP